MTEQTFHVGIKALVRDDEGKILLVGRRGKDLGMSRLDLPGGRMDVGENILEALNREIKEEIGVDIVGDTVHFMTTKSRLMIPVGSGQVGLLLVVYTANLSSHDLHLGDEEEVFEWLNPPEAAKRLEIKYDSEFCGKIADLAGADRA